jgi:hypothetical protein
VTIGIAVSGPQAGLAAFQALRAVEAVGRGAIGGFVSLVVIDANGDLAFEGVQRGGGAALFEGGSVPPRIAEARLAALMSSGPDRPEPVSQFTPGDPQAGLLAGHRLPNMPCVAGRPPNLIALDLLRSGASPQEAVAETLALDPAADAGLIVMDIAGNIALGNSAAVSERDDIGEALEEDAGSELRIGVLHNSMFPHRAIAALAVSAAIDAVAPLDRIDGEASLIGVPLRPGHGRHLVLDGTGKPQAVVAAEKACFDTCWEGSAVRRGDPVRMDSIVIGHVTREVYCIARDGHIVGGRGGDCVGWRLTNGV